MLKVLTKIIVTNSIFMAKNNILNFLGLDDKTERVYRALLYLADATATRIAEETGLVRTSVYHILEHLTSMGLVSTYTSRGTKRFVAENPNKIKAYFEQRLILAERIVPELQKDIKKSISEYDIKTYRGIEAIKSVIEDALDTKERIILSMGSSKELLKFIGGKFGYGHRRRMKGILARSIRIEGDETPTNIRLNQTKFIDKNTDFPGHILIYDKKVCIILFEKNGLAFVIENQSFSRMIKSLFELIWKN